MKTRLYLFTGSYPYSVAAENTFLPQEIAVLSKRFDEVVLVPLSIEGDRETVSLANVTVDEDFAAFRRSRNAKVGALAKAPTSGEMLRECLSHASLFARNPAALKKALVYHVQAEITREWIRRRTESSRDVKSIFCTWWFDAPTLGLARFAKQDGSTAITRAHGYDLYEARHTPAYIPFRRAALRKIDFVFADSRAGADYLADRYPEFQSRVGFSPLGVQDPGFTCAPSADGVFRLVSCSFLTPVKRIDVLIEGLAALGAARTDLRVSWTHIGDGPEKERLSTLARTSLPSTVEWSFHGYPGKQGVYDFYRQNPVDLFANVSQSEGTPVSVMEAISLGIPLLCTAVGGNVELARPENGTLLPANPAAGDISKAIQSLIGAGDLAQRRTASRRVWDERYNAARNYTAFAESILKLDEARAAKRSRGETP